LNDAIGYVPLKRWLALAALLCGLACSHGQTLHTFGAQTEPPIERLQAQVHSEPLSPAVSTALQRHSIEAFLSAPQVFEAEHANAVARIVGAVGPRSMFSKGDVVYARTPAGTGFLLSPALPSEWNIYRNLRALKDPTSNEVLGLEGEYVGRARLLSDERLEQRQQDDKTQSALVPASFEIVHAISEIRAGDRLFQSKANAWRALTPHAPPSDLAATIISIYGSGVAYASKNQIVVLDKGSKQGLEPGHLMSIRKMPSLATGLTDSTYSVVPPSVGVSGQALVFLTFDKLAYALISDVSEPVQVGDRLSGS
jgi:hypothetical protein